MERNKLSALLGEFAEEYCALRFMNKEYEVYKNWVSDGTDLLAIKGNKIRRIQVKCSRVCLQRNNPILNFQIRAKRSKELYDVDYFLFVSVDDDFHIMNTWLIPRKIFSEEKAEKIYLPMNPKHQKSNTNYRKLKKYMNRWVMQ